MGDRVEERSMGGGGGEGEGGSMMELGGRKKLKWEMRLGAKVWEKNEG